MRVCNGYASAWTDELATIPHLPATLRVERCALQDDQRGLLVATRDADSGDRQVLRPRLVRVADELGRQPRQLLVQRQR